MAIGVRDPNATAPIHIGGRSWAFCGWEGHPPAHVHEHDSLDLLGAAVWAVFTHHIGSSDHPAESTDQGQ